MIVEVFKNIFLRSEHKVHCPIGQKSCDWLDFLNIFLIYIYLKVNAKFVSLWSKKIMIGHIYIKGGCEVY
jgi:hypothetical protein